MQYDESYNVGNNQYYGGRKIKSTHSEYGEIGHDGDVYGQGSSGPAEPGSSMVGDSQGQGW